jgi:hypothetical protein
MVILGKQVIEEFPNEEERVREPGQKYDKYAEAVSFPWISILSG